ncbi:hypothetical protein CSB69_4137 [Morganella morganii]|nr:hypothetical protein CSB69_4137 [Morganella morganii]
MIFFLLQETLSPGFCAFRGDSGLFSLFSDYRFSQPMC